ncbi:MAG: phosphate signaling complex protein PhoU [Peptoniphilaceae bacterium]
MRKRFDQELISLKDEMLQMGILVERAIEKAVSLVTLRSSEIAKEVCDYEEEIDSMESLIQSHCLRLLLEQQPVAGDLRTISAALKMITDMERMGDQARDIAEICENLNQDYNIKSVDHIKEMSVATIAMVRKTINAFVEEDVESAKTIRGDDDIVDNYFVTVRDDLIQHIKEDSLNPASVIDFIMIAKYLERIADHAVNISHWVIFSIEG